MSKIHPVKYNKFEAKDENFEFFKPMTNDNDGKNIGFHYLGHSLALQLPKLETPYGFSRGREGKDEFNKKFTCTLSLDSTTDKKARFVDQLKAFEDLLVTKATENAFEWGLVSTKSAAQKATEDTIREKFTPIVKYRIDKESGEISTKYAPTFRTNFNTSPTTNEDGSEGVPIITSEVWDCDRNCINYEKGEDGQMHLVRPETISESVIPRHCEVISLVQTRSIWVAGGRFGATFRIHQVVVYQSGDFAPTGTLLITDEDDSDDEYNNQSRQVPLVTDEGVSDNETDEADEADEAPAPASKKLSLKGLKK